MEFWESPAYLHGAIAWRMYLNARRGAYTADFGMVRSCKITFESYSKLCQAAPEKWSGCFDEEKNLARQKKKNINVQQWYISRSPTKNTVAHHYDKEFGFIDQMLRHFKWTGDTAFKERNVANDSATFELGKNEILMQTVTDFYDGYASIFWAERCVAV